MGGVCQLLQGFQNGIGQALAAPNSYSNTVANLSAGALAAQQTAAQHAILSVAASRFAAEEGPLEDGGIVVGEIVGWRIWGFKEGFLTSFSAPTAWYPGHPMTGKPEDHNSEGVWAFRSPHDALHKFIQSGGGVMGSVWLSGRVIEHELGYRAQVAQIRSIDVVTRSTNKPSVRLANTEDRLKELQERYGVSDDAHVETGDGDIEPDGSTAA